MGLSATISQHGLVKHNELSSSTFSAMWSGRKVAHYLLSNVLGGGNEVLLITKKTLKDTWNLLQEEQLALIQAITGYLAPSSQHGMVKQNGLISNIFSSMWRKRKVMHPLLSNV